MNSTTETITTALAKLGALCLYPNATFDALLGELRNALPETAAATFDAFCMALSSMSQDEREELYTATFEITPAAVPYVSIHLFGEENFKRGEFMAALNARYQETGFNPGGELPDHLGNLLQFAASITEEERVELVKFCLLGPLSGMSAGLKPENPYRALLQTIMLTLTNAFPGLVAAPNPLVRARLDAHANGFAACATGCASMSESAAATPDFEPAMP